MTGFDLILLSIIIVSVFFAAIRGGLKELTTLVSLGFAAIAAFFLAEPVAGFIGGGTIAFLSAVLGVAFVSFVGFQVLTAILVSRVELAPEARLANRIGGGIFGLVRAIVLIGFLFLGYGWYLEEEYRPSTVNDALLLPIAKGSASFIEGLAPTRKSMGDENADLSGAPEDKTQSGSNGRVASSLTIGASNNLNSSEGRGTKDKTVRRENAELGKGIDDARVGLARTYDRSSRKGLDELVTTMTTNVERVSDTNNTPPGRAKKLQVSLNPQNAPQPAPENSAQKLNTDETVENQDPLAALINEMESGN
ncbi:MAG: CvpA family protein [Pseudomonadota bacterium]